MGFELWDVRTANSLGAYHSEQEALEVVASIVSSYRSRRGKEVPWLSLTRSEGAQRYEPVARGKDLVLSALRQGVVPPQVTPRSQQRRKRRAA